MHIKTEWNLKFLKYKYMKLDDNHSHLVQLDTTASRNGTTCIHYIRIFSEINRKTWVRKNVRETESLPLYIVSDPMLNPVPKSVHFLDYLNFCALFYFYSGQCVRTCAT